MAGMAIPLIGGLLGGLFGRGGQNRQNEYLRRQAEQARADAERRRQEDIGRGGQYRREEMDRIGGYRSDARSRMDPRISEATGDLQADRERLGEVAGRLFDRGGYNEGEARGLFDTDAESAGRDMTEEEQQNQFYGAGGDALKFSGDEVGWMRRESERPRRFLTAAEGEGFKYGERGEGLYDTDAERAGQSVSQSTRDTVSFSPEDEEAMVGLSTSPIAAASESAQAELLRRAAGRGNFAPGLNATIQEIARQRGRSLSEASLRARLGAEDIRSTRELQLSDRERDAARGLAGRRTDALGRILDTDIAANRDIAGQRLETERDIQQQDSDIARTVAERRMDADRAILENRAGASRYNSEARRGANAERSDIRRDASGRIGDARIGQQNIGAGLQRDILGESSGRETSRIGVGSGEDIAYSGQQTNAGLGYAGQQQDASNAARGAGEGLASTAGNNPTGMSAFTSGFTGTTSAIPNFSPVSAGPRVQVREMGSMPTMVAVTRPGEPASARTIGTAGAQPATIGAVASPGAIGRPTATARPQAVAAGGTSPLMGGSFRPQPTMGRIGRRRPTGPQMIGGASERPRAYA